MVVLDVTIVNVALKRIIDDLDFAPLDVQWILSGYALTFGGLLLLGGRMGDILGRRRLFITGLILFAGFSLLCGLSTSPSMLIAARILQGVGAAMLAPSVFSIVSVTFREGSERNKALGILGAVAGSGGALGLILGGVLTEQAGWRWCFFINVPIALVALVLALTLVEESHSDAATGHFDLFGAALVTSGLMTLVFAFTHTERVGWGSIETIGLLALAFVLLAGFVAVEQRSPHPLVPLSFFPRHRSATTSNIVGIGLGMIVGGIFLLLSLYMQQVLGYEPIKTGVAHLAVAVTAMFASGAAQATVTRVGVRPALAFGMGLLAVGTAWLTQIDVASGYWSAMFIPFVLIGIGLGFSFVPVSIAALGGVEPDSAGLASGLINTSEQIGSAFGIAIMATVATAITGPYDPSFPPSDLPQRLTEGYAGAFWIAAGCAAVALIVVLVALRGPDVRSVGSDTQP